MWILGRNSNITLSKKDIILDGIGVGSALNEMYAKFVAPSMIVSVKDGLNDRLIVMYYVQTKIRVSRIWLCLNILIMYLQLKDMKRQSLI